MPRNMLNDGADHFWYTRGRYIADISAGVTPQEIRELSNAAFTAGARWNMRETTRLNPYVSQFIEMLILLGVFDAEMVSTPCDATGGGETSATAPGDQSRHDDGTMSAMSTDVPLPDADTWHDARLL